MASVARTDVDSVLDTPDARDLAMLRSIAEGICEHPQWSNFLSLALDRFGADYANIVFRRDRNGEEEMHEIFSGAPVPPELARAYADRDGHYDPIRYHSLAPGRVYRLPELLGSDELEQVPFYRDHLSIAGIAWARLVSVDGRSGHRAWITVTRNASRPDFGEREEALMEEVAAFFKSALDIFRTLETVQLGRAIAETMVHKLNFSFMVLDRHGHILIQHEACGKASRRFLRTDGDGKVHLRSVVADKALYRLLRQYGERSITEVRTIHIEDETEFNILVTSMDVNMLSAGTTPVAVLYFPSDAAEVEHAGALQQIYGLTDSEARLGALICRGMTVRSAAASLGLTEHTGRAYLKRVLVKAGVHRQSEFVQKVLSSVVALS